ncbi:hypothetical protein BX616_005144, partial [Lobosporangium transversale]
EGPTKRRRLSEVRPHYTHHDGKQVSLPRFPVDMLKDTSNLPEQPSAFSHFLQVKAGDQIMARSLGQLPKCFAEGIYGTAKAYAHRWTVLYIPDAKDLQGCETVKDAATIICQRFIALNKDILTVEQIAKMIDFEDTTKSLVVSTARYILRNLLQQSQRKALFVIDRHEALFPDDDKASVTNKLAFLYCLRSLDTWGAHNAGACVIFTGTAHGNFERIILRNLSNYLFHVGPLSPLTFDKLFDAVLAHLHPSTRDSLRKRKDNVIRITNRVPHDLISMAELIGTRQLSKEQMDATLAQYEQDCPDYYASVAWSYFNKLKGEWKENIIQLLTKKFLPKCHPSYSETFEWEFIGSGLVYRGAEYCPINYAAQKALLGLYKIVPLPEPLRIALASDDLNGDQFRQALFQELIWGPIYTFQSTDLAGGNKKDIVLNVSGYERLRKPPKKLETSRNNGKGILINGSSDVRFDFILGYMFIQVLISSFTTHSSPEKSACIDNAFSTRDEVINKNQIEEYLDAAFGGVHQATMTTEEPADDKDCGENDDENDDKNDNKTDSVRSNDNIVKDSNDNKKRKVIKKFAVTRDGKLCDDFQIVYIHGNQSGGPPNHTGKVIEYPHKPTSTFHVIVWTYYGTRSETWKKKFAKSLATVFLVNNSQSNDFEWDFRDLGLIYRLNKDGRAMNYVLCLPAQKALFQAFTNIPHHEHILRQVSLGEVGDDFKLTLLVQFLTLTKPIVLRATNLCGKDLMEIKLDFKGHGTIQQGKTSFIHGYGHVLSHCHPTYPRFDFILDTMFIQVFAVTGFIIVYMCGSSGAQNHTGLVDKYKDLLHVSFDELKEFRTFVT